MIDLQNVSLRDPDHILINALDLKIERGEIVSLMGPSGSGKSTLLAFIAGFLSPHFQSSGDALINGKSILNLPAEKRRVGLLFQDDLLLPHLSVGQNLAFGLPRISKPERKQRVRDALTAAGMEGFEDRRPVTLSGGQRARIALLRTLLSQPDVLLLDEPFSKLDAELRNQFRDFVRTQVDQQKLPTLMVTHDVEDAEAMGGCILKIDPDGSVVSPS